MKHFMTIGTKKQKKKPLIKNWLEIESHGYQKYIILLFNTVDCVDYVSTYICVESKTNEIKKTAIERI